MKFPFINFYIFRRYILKFQRRDNKVKQSVSRKKINLSIIWNFFSLLSLIFFLLTPIISYRRLFIL